MGRSSSFTTELAEEICELIATGHSLRNICLRDNIPHIATVMRWLADEKYVDFREQYTRARDMQADYYADEIVAIADEPLEAERTKVKDDGSVERTTGDAVERSKLMIESRKWIASKLKPKKYGDKIEHTVDVTITNKLAAARERAKKADEQ